VQGIYIQIYTYTHKGYVDTGFCVLCSESSLSIERESSLLIERELFSATTEHVLIQDAWIRRARRHASFQTAPLHSLYTQRERDQLNFG